MRIQEKRLRIQEIWRTKIERIENLRNRQIKGTLGFKIQDISFTWRFTEKDKFQPQFSVPWPAALQGAFWRMEEPHTLLP